MSDYRRWYIPGGMYFFTVVTYNRRRILTTLEGRPFLHKAIGEVRKRYPFELFATVLLPDHWHLILQLPPGDDRFSLRLKRIKEEFSKQWLQAGLSEATVTRSQLAKGERGIWQPRFWEHCIEGIEDLEAHVDYIHWNPCKHGVAERVRDWEWSSFHRFVELGQYSMDWGKVEPKTIQGAFEWGEPD